MLPERCMKNRTTFGQAAASTALTLALALAGCSDDPAANIADEATTTTTPDASSGTNVPGAQTDGGGVGTGEDPPPPCDPTQAALLQADIDKVGAEYPKFDFLLAVKTPSCGLKYFSVGPNEYPEDTVELIGSATKTYVAASILKLIEQGAMSLDDPASKWLPKAPGGDKAKIRHLLQHESGFADYLSSLSVLQLLKGNTGGSFTPQELVDAAFSKKSEFEPGSKWSYSNTNYIALGMIAEAVAKKPLAQVVRDLLLTPLGLTKTFFAGAGEETIGTIADGIDANGKETTREHATLMGAAGGMFATLPDVTSWFEALCSGKVLAPSSAATYVPAPIVDGWNYGYGLVKYDAKITNGGGIAYGHAGNWPGYNTETFYFPDSKITIVATLNGMKAAPVRDVLIPAVEKTLFAKK